MVPEGRIRRPPRLSAAGPQVRSWHPSDQEDHPAEARDHGPLPAVLLAPLAFGAGAALGGRWALARAPHRGRLLAGAAAAQCVLLLVAAAVASAVALSGQGVRLPLIGLLAVAMGVQNVVVRRLAVPDPTTTVLTMTVTGLFADGVPGRVRLRRLAGLFAMLAGAVLGGVLLRRVDPSAPLCAAAAHLRTGRSDAAS